VAIDLHPGEQVLWQGSPVRRTPFTRTDLKWLKFSLGFDAVLLAVLAATLAAVNLWLAPQDPSTAVRVLLAVVAWHVLRTAEPIAWRYVTLPRTTYYITDRRVLAVRGRRVRATRLSEISDLTAVVEAGGSGRVRVDGRIAPDGFLQATVGELLHVRDVDEVVRLLSTLTGSTSTLTRSTCAGES
jgi:hypothetical protein